MPDLAPEPEFDLRIYVQILFRRKWLILIFAGALTGLVALGTALQPKLYVAKASVLGGREAPRLLTSDPLPQERFRDKDYLKTQVAILTSRSFLKRTTTRLNKEGFYGKVLTGEEAERQTEDMAGRLQARLIVESSEDSQVFRIGVEG